MNLGEKPFKNTKKKEKKLVNQHFSHNIFYANKNEFLLFNFLPHNPDF